jgi:hypothetical protein
MSPEPRRNVCVSFSRSRASLKGYERRSITKRPKLVQPGEAQAMIAPGWFHCLVGAKHGSN